MFGKRPTGDGKPEPAAAKASPPAPTAAKPAAPQAPPVAKPAGAAAPAVVDAPKQKVAKPAPPIAAASKTAASGNSAEYYQTKTSIFNALIDTIDLSQLAQLDAVSARGEIGDIVNEIISIKAIILSVNEQERLLDDICNDVLGYGPLEPFGP